MLKYSAVNVAGFVVREASGGSFPLGENRGLPPAAQQDDFLLAQAELAGLGQVKVKTSRTAVNLRGSDSDQLGQGGIDTLLRETAEIDQMLGILRQVIQNLN